jgi:hypothetical protein
VAKDDFEDEEILDDDVEAVDDDDEDDDDLDLELDDDLGLDVIAAVDEDDDDDDEDLELDDDDDDAVVEDDDDEEADTPADDDEAEESLDVLLAREAGDDDTMVRLDDEPTGGLVSVTTPIGADEFTCRSCFLVKRRAQLADEKQMICFDCA